MAERRAQDEGPEPNAFGDRGDAAERGQRLERRDRGRIGPVPGEGVEEVIGDPDRVEPKASARRAHSAASANVIWPVGSEKP